MTETPSLVERHDAEWRRMLADAERIVRGGSRNVSVDAAALIGLFATLDAYREREAAQATPRVRVVTCIVCGTRDLPVGQPCPRCGHWA